jgi:predicted transcriptional regulator of viral defense system
MGSDREHPDFAGPSEAHSAQSAQELEEEKKKIRRFQLMMDMVLAVISQSPRLTVDEAAEMVAETERVAQSMFPEKELAYRLIYKPRLQRVMRERYRIQ